MTKNLQKISTRISTENRIRIKLACFVMAYVGMLVTSILFVAISPFRSFAQSPDSGNTGDLVIIDGSLANDASEASSNVLSVEKTVIIREIIVYVDNVVQEERIEDNGYMHRKEILTYSPLREKQEISVDVLLRRIKITERALKNVGHLDSKSIFVEYEIIAEDATTQDVIVRIFSDVAFPYGWNGGNAYASMYFLLRNGATTGVHVGATRVGSFYHGNFIPLGIELQPLWRFEFGITGEFLWVVPTLRNSVDEFLHYAQGSVDGYGGFVISPAYKLMVSQRLQLNSNRSEYEELAKWSSLSRVSLLGENNFSGTDVFRSYVRYGLHTKVSVSDLSDLNENETNDVTNTLYWLAFDLEGQVGFRALYDHAIHARIAGQLALNGNSDLPDGLATNLEHVYYAEEHMRSMLYVRVIDGNRPSRGVDAFVTGLEYYGAWPIGNMLVLGALFYSDIAFLQNTPKGYGETGMQDIFMLGFGPGLYVDIANPVNIRVKIGVGFVQHSLQEAISTGYFIDIRFNEVFW